MPLRVCRCGSGLPRWELCDTAGLHCAFVCEECEPVVRARYNPAIFEQGTPYSASGVEEDIFIDWRSDNDCRDSP